VLRLVRLVAALGVSGQVEGCEAARGSRNWIERAKVSFELRWLP